MAVHGSVAGHGDADEELEPKVARAGEQLGEGEAVGLAAVQQSGDGRIVADLDDEKCAGRRSVVPSPSPLPIPQSSMQGYIQENDGGKSNDNNNNSTSNNNNSSSSSSTKTPHACGWPGLLLTSPVVVKL